MPVTYREDKICSALFIVWWLVYIKVDSVMYNKKVRSRNCWHVFIKFLNGYIYTINRKCLIRIYTPHIIEPYIPAGFFDQFNKGGGTVIDVRYDKSDILDAPRRFEAGLQNYAGIVATKHSVEYIEGIGLNNIHQHEIELNRHLQKRLEEMPDVSIIGPHNPADRGGITSITVKDFNVHDLVMILDERIDVMMRAGRHCVHGWFNHTGIDGTLRVSTYLYNTIDEIDTFSDALMEVLTEE